MTTPHDGAATGRAAAAARATTAAQAAAATEPAAAAAQAPAAEPAVLADAALADRAAVADLAAAHGLALDPRSVRFNEAGLDYRVAFANDADGAAWVLRMPRRPDVASKVGEEAAILRHVRPLLSVAVPDWRIQGEDLIAYPLLPGAVGLTLDDNNEPVWHYDRESPRHARSLGLLIAELHGLDTGTARSAGVPGQTPEEVRREWSSVLADVRAEFAVAPELSARYSAWLDDDGLWPGETVFTHGELYPAHLLLDEDQDIVSVLDWTTARVGDPALDFAFHHQISGPAAFRTAVDAYTEATGRALPRLEERCAAIFSAAPLTYARFALTTGVPEHAAAAAALLNPAGG
ncbi:macrolide 2'-phosphotransferase [Arthrobacter halodurans]|uniref:Macrolide 2'-phosphotransferase n=1 Tax=Arthrobacter halodurans TaxID=516699 RepID=A0ABV4UQ67_9MICC